MRWRIGDASHEGARVDDGVRRPRSDRQQEDRQESIQHIEFLRHRYIVETEAGAMREVLEVLTKGPLLAPGRLPAVLVLSLFGAFRTYRWMLPEKNEASPL